MAPNGPPVLVTNDDGIDSEGIIELARCAVEAGFSVTVAAPSWDSSGASASFTAVEDHGRIVQQARTLAALPEVAAVAVEAAPAFIVRAAVAGAFGEPPELVLSGANHGPNLGYAVLHSGTVGAALTAATLGRRGLAVSVDTGTGAGEHVHHWDTVRALVAVVLPHVAQDDAGPSVVSLNVPDVPLDGLRGVQAAALAPFGAVRATVTEAGGEVLELEYRPVEEEAPPGTDAALLAEGYATLTPLRPVCAGPLEGVAGLAAAADGCVGGR